MRDHSKLRAFELADELVLLIYEVSKKFPKDEIYGLTSQMRRASVSIPSNIVEGCGRESDKEFSRFLEMAFGSLRETHYQWTVAVRLQYTPEDLKLAAKFVELEKILFTLIKKIQNTPKATS